MSISLIGQVQGQAFQELLQVSLKSSCSVGLVAPTSFMDGRSAALIGSLADHLLDRREVRQWPGVEVPDWARPSIRYLFTWNAQVSQILYGYCQDLFGWQRLALPADLHLLDNQGKVFLGSITSEEDAWVELRLDDWRDLVKKTAALRKVPVSEDS